MLFQALVKQVYFLGAIILFRFSLELGYSIRHLQNE